MTGRPARDYGSEGWGLGSPQARQVTGSFPILGEAFLVVLGATGCRGRCVPDRPVDAGHSRLLADTPT